MSAPVTAVFGMTLCNNAPHLRQAVASLLAQTRTDFAIVMLDDGSEDETESIAREFERVDRRVSYFRHEARQGMVPTWREVFEKSTSRYPSAEYFAWVSDHDVWAPAWLATLVAELDAHPEAVLTYPLAPRVDDEGHTIDKTPRTFDTTGLLRVSDRWRRFCWEGFGSGDMVYGLARVASLRQAGVFRPVLNPDRLLIAELTLQGQIRQVPEQLWFRRQAVEASVARQRTTLFAGDVPPGFGLPPALQHARILKREYGHAHPGRIQVGAGMRALYLVSSAWREFRKTETSKSVGRGVDHVHFVKKLAKKSVRVSVYCTLVTAHAAAASLRRIKRRTVYRVAVLSHRLGLRTPRDESRTR
jgi:hypothetical protein